MKSTIEDPAVIAYFQKFPQEVQNLMQSIRSIILSQAPYAAETLSYGMPAYKTHKKPLIYYAAYKNHIGLYATPSGHSAFAAELAKYKQGKGSVQFPINEELPIDLINRIIAFRVLENNKK